MAAKYDGKTAAEWLDVADDALYQANHTVNDDTKDYWLGVYRKATLKASIADGLDDDNDTQSGGNDTIPNYDYNISNTTDNTVLQGTTNADVIYSNASNVTIYGGSGKDTVRIAALSNSANTNVIIYGESADDRIENYGADNSLIDGGAGNDVIDNWGKNVTISGGTGNDSINLARGGATNCLIKYNSGDGNDTVVGFVTSSTLSIGGGTYSSTKSGNDVIVTVGTSKITLVGAANLSSVNIKGTLSGGLSDSTLKTVTNSTPSPVTVGSAVKTIDASTRTTAVQIIGNALANSIKGGSGNDTFSGGDGNDLLYGQSGDDKLYGQAGNDSLYGGIGNDTLSGGAGDDYLKGSDGSDVFIYSAGNDIIADYTVGQDKIKLSNASIKSSAVSGNNVILTLSTGKITVTGGKNQNITVIDANGNETTKKYGSTGGKTLTVTKNATLGSDYQNANASALTKAVKIVGNKSANVILGGSKNDTVYGNAGNDSLVGNAGNDVLYGGFGKDTLKGGAGNDKLYGGAGNDVLYGGSGDDTLNGGAGNDYLKGGDGSDTFIYSSGGGNDVIFGFDSKDTLTLDSLDFTATYKNNVVTLKFDEGSVALKDFGSTKTFHINDETYQISGSKFVQK